MTRALSGSGDNSNSPDPLLQTWQRGVTRQTKERCRPIVVMVRGSHETTIGRRPHGPRRCGGPGTVGIQNREQRLRTCYRIFAVASDRAGVPGQTKTLRWGDFVSTHHSPLLTKSPPTDPLFHLSSPILLGKGGDLRSDVGYSKLFVRFGQRTSTIHYAHNPVNNNNGYGVSIQGSTLKWPKQKPQANARVHQKEAKEGLAREAADPSPLACRGGATRGQRLSWASPCRIQAPRRPLGTWIHLSE